MEEILNIFLKAAFIENMALAFFLGMCSFLAVSNTVKTSMGLGIAVTFVLIFTTPLNFLINYYFLKPGALTWISDSLKDIDLSYLSFLIFIATIATAVQIVEMVVEKSFPSLYNSLGIFLPLIAVNCAILGASLFMQEREYSSLSQVIPFSLGSGIGWLLAIVSLAAIREKITYSNIPEPLKGPGIAFITTGLLAIAFMSFMGIQL
ncbi:MAG: NADH:ubiquinone reductase (Na(+)-transporting) subunit E [Bacteroidales bacterium]|nr:NADH:ubiquinone reductase (Na(+)-transporting) subunit E [Bacteroidales bacterium]